MASRTVSEIQTIVRPFVEIAFLRRGPQDLPDSILLLAIVLVAHTVISIVLNAVILDGWVAVLAGITDSLLIAILTGFILYLYGFTARIVQTISAIAGTNAIITLVAIPLFTWSYGVQERGAESPLAALLVFGIIAWSLGVWGHILRYALSVPFILGILVALAFYGISYTVFSSLFPVSA